MPQRGNAVRRHTGSGDRDHSRIAPKIVSFVGFPIEFRAWFPRQKDATEPFSQPFSLNLYLFSLYV